MAQFKVNIAGEATASVGDQVAWYSEKYGIRSGKVIQLTEYDGYGGNTRVAVKIRPDRQEKRYFSPQTIYKLNRIFKLAAPIAAPTVTQVTPVPPNRNFEGLRAFASEDAAPSIPSRY